MTEAEKQTEDRIFESATEIFIEKGMDGARMQDIANHAGINKALLHYYYRTKDHLFEAVFDKMANVMFSRFSLVFDEKATLEEKIRFFFREHISFLQKNPRLPAFILNEINRNPERMKKLLQRFSINEFWNTLESLHHDELLRYNITREKMPQLMTSMAAISIFPFAAKGILEVLFEKAGYDYNEYLEERKDFAADFIIRAIKGPDSGQNEKKKPAEKPSPHKGDLLVKAQHTSGNKGKRKNI
ncbi:MAG: TetR/AcrR family transcriptional regulator [Bacteroidales bacterium]|jgi:AcrR family transcriptional regulator|nr:TetR/AcrR family transcriptional regulator [Bacteroidales bacterium]